MYGKFQLSFSSFLLFGLFVISCSENGCPQICSPGAQRCATSINGVVVCAQSALTGCFQWGTLPCPSGQSCQTTGGTPTCTPDNGNSNKNCINPQHTQKCVGNTIYWFDECGKQQQAVHTCTKGTTCKDAQCISGGGNNQNNCTLGSRRCTANNTVETCIPGSDNKGTWGQPVKCSAGRVCQNGGCLLPNNNNNNNNNTNNNNNGCTNKCQAGQVQCLGSAYQNCTKASNGCYDWGQALACPTNQVCKDGKCQPSSGNCQDQCTRGHQKCIGQQFQVCQQVGQCNQWGSPQNCGSGQTCKTSSPVIECVCLPGYQPNPGGQSCSKSNNNNNTNNNNNNTNNNNTNNNNTNNNNTNNNNTNPNDPNCLHNTLEAEVLRIVNVERQKAGRSPLKCESKLVTASRSWSTSQCKRGGLSHANLGTRVKATGLRVSGYGENVAYGSRSAAGVMRMWMNSSGHRRNILSSTYTHLGVGLDTCNGRYFWTQIFVRMR